MSVSHSLVVWADDVVVLGMGTTAQNIVNKLQHTCFVMVQERILSFGLHPNFKDGKTEAIVDPRGEGAITANLSGLEGETAVAHFDAEATNAQIGRPLQAPWGLITHGCTVHPEVRHRVGRTCGLCDTNPQQGLYENTRTPVDVRMMVLSTTSLMQYNADPPGHMTSQGVCLLTC